jgi:hypothetical protein
MRRIMPAELAASGALEGMGRFHAEDAENGRSGFHIRTLRKVPAHRWCSSSHSSRARRSWLSTTTGALWWW